MWWFYIITGIAATTCFIYCVCFYILGNKICYELKWRYLLAILSQEQEWFAQRDVDELPTEVYTNLTEIEKATGKSVAFIIYSLSVAVGGLAITFY